MDSNCSLLIVKQIVNTPTTSRSTSLDIILNNPSNFSPLLQLCSLGGSYLPLLLSPSPNFKHSFSIIYGSYHSLKNSGLLSFKWPNAEDWPNVYNMQNLDDKIATFDQKLNNKYVFFPRKIIPDQQTI